MSVEIVVPALGESVSEATVAKWYKKAGEVNKNTVVNQKATTAAALGTEAKVSTIHEKKVDPVSTMPPSVQKLVTENNLNPATIAGTGKDGRINKGDVLNVLVTTAAKLILSASRRTGTTKPCSVPTATPMS